MTAVDRRSVLLAGAGVAGVAACSACHVYGPGDAAPAPPKRAAPGAAPVVLCKPSDVPVGGGKLVPQGDSLVVVTQPSAGVYKCFSGICTHAGCKVASVSGKTINCQCHGSKFSIVDGSVTNGPATAPLPAVPIAVGTRTITLA